MFLLFLALDSRGFDFSGVLSYIFWFCFRTLLDRTHTDLDNICQNLDSDPEPEPLASALSGSLLHNSNTSTSETNTSDPTSSSRFPSSSSSTPMDLSQILLNIKSCRWRHFRPRTLSHHPLGGGDLSRRGFRDLNRTTSGLTRTLSGGGSTQNRPGLATTPVNGEFLLSFSRLLSVHAEHGVMPFIYYLAWKVSWPHTKLI